MKKLLCLILSVVMVLGLLAGCGKTPAAEPKETQAQSGGDVVTPPDDAKPMILRFGTNSEPTGFDPHTISEEASLRVINQLYETLVTTNPDMTYAGELAETWEIPDEVTYIFYLRKGVKFHSGREMKAEDVVYSFDRVLGKTEAGDIGALGSSASYYKNVTSVEAIDEYTVKFTLAAPNAAFLGTLSSNYGAIVDKDVIAANGDLMRCDGGTGPFALGEWLPDNYVTLTKFEEYWAADRVQLDGITYYLIGDEAARLAALRTGEIDIANLSAANVTAAEKDANLKVLSYQTNNYMAMGCNLSTEALQDIRVRQAMSYAIDRQTLINIVYNGQAAITSMVPPSLGHWSLDVSDMDLYQYNVDKAKALMEEAGYGPDNRLQLKVAAGLMDEIRQAAVVIQQQLSEIYIDLEITNLESGEYVDIWGKMMTPEAGFDLMIVHDGAGTDPNRSISFFFGTGASANVFGFSNERVDELCALGLGTPDEAVREGYYNEAQLICIEDCTKLCFASPMSYFVTNVNVEGFAPSAANSSDFRDTYIK
ncbi:MAG: ABC transporter substrate-binding protein [Oscillospiraceae bacterium]|nr:ABC transporter substrate-binding protein [Oscillospiraceae bacterium]